MRAPLSVTVLVAGCGMTESEQAEANYNDLAGTVTESCGTFRTTVPSIRCTGPAVEETWTEAHCTGISTTTSNCPSVVGTDCDYPPL